jgi:T5SS/PEP-CTERM-associated repeat protein
MSVFERGVRFGRRLTLVAAWLAALATESRAVDMFWSVGRGDGSGVFSVAENWTGGNFFNQPPPSSNDRAIFGMTSNLTLPRTYTVTFTANATNEQLVVEDDRVTFDLNGHVYNTTGTPLSPFAMFLGRVPGRSARLTITDGIVSTPFRFGIEIGDVGDASGFLTVSTGGLLIGSPILNVGDDGNGTLTIQNNGDIIADRTSIGRGATGTATITGGGSALVATERWSS